ncbi:MAG TPA: NAD/NADP octopine/nopaline dehydrogenase family protein [Solirubrobacter sp.]|nr:NAD/NADP octopine/nopaline dehydrogenase family protein [Solirubrobacter sp.]
MSGRSVAILGAGAGGIAAAAVLARRGHDVRLYNRTPGRIAGLREAGGVEIEGDLGDGFAAIPTITTDVAEALSGAELALCCVPAYGQRPLAELAAPHLEPGAALVLAPGSAGSLEVAQVLAAHGRDVHDEILLGETVTLPQSARVTPAGRVRIRLDSAIRMAAFPACNNERLYAAVGDLIRWRESPNVLDTGIHNVNFLIHPAPMLLNYAAVERSDGTLSIMNEGMTDGVLRCLDAIDREKMALATALGLEPISIDDLYREAGSGPHIYRERGEPFGDEGTPRGYRDRIWPRYIDEDTPYGTVMLSSLGRQLGVPMPACDAVNTLLSVLERSDFVAGGRTTETLGLAGMSAAEIRHYLFHGGPRARAALRRRV